MIITYRYDLIRYGTYIVIRSYEILTNMSSGYVVVISCSGGDNRRGSKDHSFSRFLGRVHGGTRFADHRVEPVHRVGRVIHRADGAVGFHQTVLATDHIAVSFLRLLFDVASGRIVYAIIVRVARRCLSSVMIFILFYFFTLFEETR